MSDDEKLIDTRTEGLACLCFRNKSRLSVDEITEIFSKHGKVVSINCAGDESGYRFVRFHTKAEALKCLRALKGDSRIQLQPVKSKLKEFNDNYSHDQFAKKKQANFYEQKNDRSLCKYAETYEANSSNGSQSSEKSNANDNWRQNRYDATKNDFNGFSYMNNTNGETSKENSDSQRSVTSDHRNLTKKPLVSKLRKKNETNSSNHRLNAAMLEQLHKLRGTIADTFKLPSNDSIFKVSEVPAVGVSSEINSRPLSLHNSSREQSVVTDILPPLVDSVSPTQSCVANVQEAKTNSVLASDVILANIHSNIGLSNIYNMLKKFGPVYVSDIETVPHINVRFCYAYFQTPTDALAVEQSFDGINLNGQNLITLRSQRLQTEAGIF